jgi:isocitrate lyase
METEMTTTDTDRARTQRQADDDIAALERRWATEPRWKGVRRDYAAADVVRLRGTFPVDCSFARAAADRMWDLLNRQDYVHALGALSGGQAVQMAKAGLEAIYLSGWQVAADGNLSEQVYPDQSLYPSNSVPALIRRINHALRRADQVQWSESFGNQDGAEHVDYLVPIIADAESGFGGPLNAYELMRSMIEAGAAGVHWEDQLSSEKKCGHMGGKVLVPIAQHIRTLTAARLAADVLDVPTLVVARTDSLGASLLTSDIDERDRAFTTGTRTPEGFFEIRAGIDSAIARGLAFAPYSDLVWCETSTPDLSEARVFAEALLAEYPDTMLAYNCSPSFNWKSQLDDTTIAGFQKELASMGYRFQFITLAGFHSLNASMFELAHQYRREGMTAYVALQEHEFELEQYGYSATRHQREVGAGYFDDIASVVSGGTASTLALVGSTEEGQFG